MPVFRNSTVSRRSMEQDEEKRQTEREREKEREDVGNGRSRGSCRTVKREQPKRTILDCRLARGKQILERTPPARSNPIYRSAIMHAVSDLGTINQRDKYRNRDAPGWTGIICTFSDEAALHFEGSERRWRTNRLRFSILRDTILLFLPWDATESFHDSVRFNFYDDMYDVTRVVRNSVNERRATILQRRMIYYIVTTWQKGTSVPRL